MQSAENPMGTDGFEFIEYAALDSQILAKLFEQLGFSPVAKHRSKDVTLYRQGEINFILNHEQDSFAQSFARVHGPSVCALAIRVQNAGEAYKRAVNLGAKPYTGKVGPMELNIPALTGIGGSLIYLVDRYDKQTIYDVDFVSLPETSQNPFGAGLTVIDHLTHNVQIGRMNVWAEFYEKLFNFREIRYFDIKGKKTGLTSRALISPCGKIRIPINEPSDKKSQIQEYLDVYHGEGIQHIALSTKDIFATVEWLKNRGVEFMETPEIYYDLVDQRIPNHGQDVARLRKNRILIDGESLDKDGSEDLLLQIFTQTVIGPIFFEIIQRRGNQGFGEGNFQALFEAIERDQIERGAV